MLTLMAQRATVRQPLEVFGMRILHLFCVQPIFHRLETWTNMRSRMQLLRWAPRRFSYRAPLPHPPSWGLP